MSNVFVSYSRNNHDVVMNLAADVKALGHQVWMDHELSGGQAWWDQILMRVRDTDIFVFSLAPEALDSVACKREYEYAAALGKPILPVLVGQGVSTNLLPPTLAAIQLVDYSAQDRDAALSLARAIGSVPPAKPLPEPLPSPPEVPISYLGGLVQRVASNAELNSTEQGALLLDIKASLRDPETANDGKELLARMKKRRDLLATIAAEIDQILHEQRAVTPIRSQPIPAAAPLPRQPAATVNKRRRWLLLVVTMAAYGVLGSLLFAVVDNTRVGSQGANISDEDALIIASGVSVLAFFVTVFANRISRKRRWTGVTLSFIGFAALGGGLLMMLLSLGARGDNVSMAIFGVWGLGLMVTLIIALKRRSRSIPPEYAGDAESSNTAPPDNAAP